MFWQTSRRTIALEKTLVMAILNATPDSFSDGGEFFSVDQALRETEKYVKAGADIIDVGGESTRPGGKKVPAAEEARRVMPLIAEISRRFDLPISIDTSKSEVAAMACEAGAEIINDVSGLTFDEKIGQIAAAYETGLVLMHLRGSFETMHRQEPVADILDEVAGGLSRSIEKARKCRVSENRIALDVGIGFSKTFEQNLELLARLGELAVQFKDFPILIGASRKSFIGKITEEPDAGKRLPGSLAAASIAVWNGAHILRVHDIEETVQAVRVVEAIKNWRKAA